MSTALEVEKAIETLPPEELSKLREWFAERESTLAAPSPSLAPLIRTKSVPRSATWRAPPACVAQNTKCRTKPTDFFPVRLMCNPSAPCKTFN